MERTEARLELFMEIVGEMGMKLGGNSSLEMNVRLEMGQKLLRLLGSTLSFFKIGVKAAVLSEEGTIQL